jgi:signal transduction histidine kinase
MRLPDLILLDIRMPGMNGYEVCRHLKQSPLTSSIPVIFLSALQDHASVLEAFHSGGIDYISKPYMAEEVLARVGTHMELLNMRRGLEELVQQRTRQLEAEIVERKNAESALLQTQLELEALSGHMEEVREHERTSIARELHDELGQALTVIRIDLMRLAADANSGVQEKVRNILETLDHVSNAARAISDNLRPGLLDALGLPAAIQAHVRKFTQHTGIPCQLQLDPDLESLPKKLATALFRIAQESLTNVARHARAQHTVIQLARLGSSIVLVIEDDGVGIPPVLPSGRRSFGLLGMKERARLLGGRFTVESEAGSGTRIEVMIPEIEETA